MKMIDKAIALNFKLIKEPLQMIGVLSFCMIICLMIIIFIPVALILSFVITYMVIKIYKTLFVDSLFGESESIYNALPIPTKEAIVSRIFVGMIATIAAEFMVALGVFIGTAFMFDDFNMIFVLQSILGSLYDAGLPMTFLFVVIFVMVNFFMVTTSFASCLQSYKRSGKIGLNIGVTIYLVIGLSNYFISVAPLSVLAPYGTLICIAVVVLLTGTSLWAIRYVKRNLIT